MMRREPLISLAIGATLIALWEAMVHQFHPSPLVMPAPSVITLSLWRGLTSGFLLPHISRTVFETVLGLLLGTSLGFIGGVLLGESRRLRRIFMPFVLISQVVPKLALAPLFIVWFGFGTLPIVVMTALICFFPLLENTVTSMQQVDNDKLELFRMLRASRWQTLIRLKIPSGLPNIMAGFRVAVVLAWVGAVVAEFIGASRGLGALIIGAQGSMDTALMFAVLTLITVLGLASYKAAELFEHYLLRSRFYLKDTREEK
jgi:NitT/TauT family transport system permease protein